VNEVLNALRTASRFYHEGDRSALVVFLQNLGLSAVVAEAFVDYKLLPPAPEMVEDLLAGKDYQALIDALGLRQRGTPRNLPAWQIAGAVAGFPVSVLGDNLLAGNIDPVPASNGHSTFAHVSFMDIVRGKEVGASLSIALAKTLSISKSKSADFASRIERLGCLAPNSKMSVLIANMLKGWREGKEVVVWGAFCPDYSYEETGDPITPYRYTFSSVGNGVGLVADRLITLADGLRDALSMFNITPRFVFTMADTEVNIPGLCGRLDVSPHEFLERCRASAIAVEKVLREKNIAASVEMFYECHGKNFDEYEASARLRMERGDFGNMVYVGIADPARFVNGLVTKYKSFYEAWHGETTETENRKRVLTQAAEYAAFARVMAEIYPASLQIAADRPDMQAFGGFFTPVPMLCKKHYYA